MRNCELSSKITMLICRICGYIGLHYNRGHNAPEERSNTSKLLLNILLKSDQFSSLLIIKKTHQIVSVLENS